MSEQPFLFFQAGVQPSLSQVRDRAFRLGCHDAPGYLGRMIARVCDPKSPFHAVLPGLRQGLADAANALAFAAGFPQYATLAHKVSQAPQLLSVLTPAQISVVAAGLLQAKNYSAYALLDAAVGDDPRLAPSLAVQGADRVVVDRDMTRKYGLGFAFAGGESGGFSWGRSLQKVSASRLVWECEDGMPSYVTDTLVPAIERVLKTARERDKVAEAAGKNDHPFAKVAAQFQSLQARLRISGIDRDYELPEDLQAARPVVGGPVRVVALALR
jgi:hypothetical protein